jgi:predicted 3-demethylubiquinone-9 3-methyltransferase (glyoxalase superfamily)
MQKITTTLWYNTQAEEAAKLYVSLFPNSKVLNVSTMHDAGPEGKDTVTIVNFTLDGQEFTAFNAGPQFKFNESISLTVNCENQAEVDRLWEALSAGGEVQQCGWLKDRYGLSWQIVPTALGELMGKADAEQSKRVMAAMLKMVKLDIQGLQDAYDGK